MAKHNANQDSSISDSLHPFVNIAIIGLVLMFVAAVWTFFDSDRYEAWLDVVVTGLFVIANSHSRTVLANLASQRARGEGLRSC
jgi:hypothetical protein